MQNIEHAKHTKYAYRICKKLQDEEDMTHVHDPTVCFAYTLCFCICGMQNMQKYTKYAKYAKYA